jgi:hypothetical protein
VAATSSHCHFLSLADSLQSTPQSQFPAPPHCPSAERGDRRPDTGNAGSRQPNDTAAGTREDPAGRVSVDAARQYLAYLDQLEPVVAQQVATLCSST